MITGTQKLEPSNRAVSPVIGVILMVAITVILAAVIGAFVLEIGDQQETAPNTSFDTEQAVEHYCHSCAPPNYATWSMANLTTVKISHAGGNNVDISNVQVKLEGNASTYGAEPKPDDWNPAYPNYKPTPDVWQTLGTNEQFEFSSGETWLVHSGSGGDLYDGLSHENWVRIREKDDKPPCIPLHYSFEKDGQEAANFNADGCNDHSTNHGLEPITQGDELNVVWTASSGGKTQTLFKYTVQ